MAKIIVYLGDQERNALLQLAQRELRLPRAQAALIIRQELVRQGVLSLQSPATDTASPHETQTGVTS
jgi:hypothetical protein